MPTVRLPTRTIAPKYKIKRKRHLCTHDTIAHKLHWTQNIIDYYWLSTITFANELKFQRRISYICLHVILLLVSTFVYKNKIKKRRFAYMYYYLYRSISPSCIYKLYKIMISVFKTEFSFLKQKMMHVDNRL